MAAKEQDAAGPRGTRLLELQQNMANRWVSFIGEATQRMMSGKVDPAGWTKSYYDFLRGLSDDAGRMAELLWATGQSEDKPSSAGQDDRSSSPSGQA